MTDIIKNLTRWIPLGKVPEISPTDLRELSRAQEVQILDVRTRIEYNGGHLAGAINTPITDLSSRLTSLSLDKKKKVVAICLSAHRSILAVRILREAGFEDAQQLAGGMAAWKKLYPGEVVTD